MTRAHPWSATWPAIRLAVALLCTAGPALGLQQAGAGSVPVEAEVPPAWTPPGYYQFFHKSGALERLEAEVQRDEAIAAGAIHAEALDGLVPDISLPDARGRQHALRDLSSRRRLVITTFRTWW